MTVLVYRYVVTENIKKVLKLICKSQTHVIHLKYNLNFISGSSQNRRQPYGKHQNSTTKISQKSKQWSVYNWQIISSRNRLCKCYYSIICLSTHSLIRRPCQSSNNYFGPERWSIESTHPITLFTHFKTNTKSIAIYRVLRCCELLKNQNIVTVHEIG